jgi:hypothetical protein
MTGSFVPLGTQAGKGVQDRSPDLRLFSHLPKRQAKKSGLLSVVFSGHSREAKQPWLNSCLSIRSPIAWWTRREAGALTVAGQWRIFTAFPNILTIAVMNCAAP